jgi:hypothetical protein
MHGAELHRIIHRKFGKAVSSFRTSSNVLRQVFGAPGRTRTSTMFPPPDFESGASTNSATGARRADHTGGSGGVNAGVTPRPPKSADAFVMSQWASAIDRGDGSGYRDASRSASAAGSGCGRPMPCVGDAGAGRPDSVGAAYASFDAFT